MSSILGITPHLQKFYSTQLNKADQPTLSLLSSLKALNQIIIKKQSDVLDNLQNRKHITQFINLQEIQKLIYYQQQIKDNQNILKIMSICQDIDVTILGYSNDIQIADFDQFQRLKQRLKSFRNLYQLIQKLDQLFTTIQITTQNKPSPQQSQNTKNSQQLSKLKQQYFTKLKYRLYHTAIQLYYSSKRIQKITQALSYFNLPLKKKNNSQNQHHQNQMIQQNLYKNSLYLNHANIIIQALLCQYCYYCLQKKLQLILNQDTQLLDTNILSNSMNEQQNPINNIKYFISPFFQCLWKIINQSIHYIFIDCQNIGKDKNAYQIDQPNWLFDYMEEIFRINYQFIKQNILVLLKECNETIQAIDSIQKYMVNYNYKYFFFNFILLRLKNDLKIIQKNPSKIDVENQNQKYKNGFIIFNFLDQLYILQQKLNHMYKHQPNFIQNILIWANNQSKIDVLQLNFDYEHFWFQQRIFNDFYNINYSNIIDLKNVQAYNITINFIQIFEKLYNKFRKITNQKLHIKINQTYYQKLIHLIRHIKTSFQRIYKNGQIDKYQILVSYKKVQHQFRNYFQQFIKQSPKFQATVKQQFYQFLDNYIQVLTLQQLTPIHQQLYDSLSSINSQFRGKKTVSNSESIKKNWLKIYEQWQLKLIKIHKIHPQYQDIKLRQIFFTFLQGIEFCQDGYLLFITLFQPFLVTIFTIDGLKIIKLLLEMSKTYLKQYCTLHYNNVLFLTTAQIKSIQKSTIKQKYK